LTTLGYTMVLGKPLILWGGMVLGLMILVQVLGAKKLPFDTHRLLGYAILLLALGHAFLGLAAYFP